MKRITRDVVYYEHSRSNVPTLWIEPGETFVAETELCSGSWLRSVDDVWTRAASSRANPTVCVGVVGAGKDHMLAVTIEDIVVDEVGYTGFSPGMTPFPDWIRQKEWGVVTRTVPILEGFVHWHDGLRIPIDPMVGTLGTAPEFESLFNGRNGPYGGNMDAQEARRGTTVYLPVYVPGAILHIGDVHAVQGDGEINCGGGIECRSEVTMTVDLLPKPDRMTWPRMIDSTHVMTVGCARPAEDAFRHGVQDLIYWMVDEYGFREDWAHLLLGQVLEARCTQFVDPTYTYICKIRKEYLVSDR